jgi:hypothetical protein
MAFEILVSEGEDTVDVIFPGDEAGEGFSLCGAEAPRKLISNLKFEVRSNDMRRMTR